MRRMARTVALPFSLRDTTAGGIGAGGTSGADTRCRDPTVVGPDCPFWRASVTVTAETKNHSMTRMTAKVAGVPSHSLYRPLGRTRLFVDLAEDCAVAHVQGAHRLRHLIRVWMVLFQCGVQLGQCSLDGIVSVLAAPFDKAR